MKIKLIASVLVLVVALTGVLGATAAMFSDFGTSTGNTFTAGSLDLQINGKDGNVKLFDELTSSAELMNLIPENMTEEEALSGATIPAKVLKSHYDITNVGTIDGYLNIKRINVTDNENGRIDPEIKFGDTTDDSGELSRFMNLQLFIDLDGDNTYDTGELKLFDGRLSTLEAAINTLSTMNIKIAAGATAKVVGVVYAWYRANPSWQWGNGGNNDNMAQTDSVVVDLVFTLDQSNDLREPYQFQNLLPDVLPTNPIADVE